MAASKEDPLSKQFKHRLLLQVHNLSQNAYAIQTNTGFFMPNKKKANDPMRQTFSGSLSAKSKYQASRTRFSCF